MTWLTQLSGHQQQQLEQLAAPPEPQENGKGPADGRKWLWVRARLARVTLLLPTSWDGRVFPRQQENRPILSHHHHHGHITMVMVITLLVLPCPGVRRCAGTLPAFLSFILKITNPGGKYTFPWFRVKETKA